MSVPAVGSTGEDARSAGNTDSLNESTPAQQRSNRARSELGKGPKVGDKGEYQPARYPLSPRPKKNGKPGKVLHREDR